jgi:transposase-like protein
MNSNRSGRRYDREFKNNAVALVRGGRGLTPGRTARRINRLKGIVADIPPAYTDRRSPTS